MKESERIDVDGWIQASNIHGEYFSIWNKSPFFSVSQGNESGYFWVIRPSLIIGKRKTLNGAIRLAERHIKEQSPPLI